MLEHAFMGCPLGSAATAWPILADLFVTPLGTPVDAIALSNDDLINGDTPLAVDWDTHWQGASRGFQRLQVKIEADTRHPAYEDAADGQQASDGSMCVATVSVLLLIWWCIFIRWYGKHCKCSVLEKMLTVTCSTMYFANTALWPLTSWSFDHLPTKHPAHTLMSLSHYLSK